MTDKTLLQKALAIKSIRKPHKELASPKEMEEVALAWVRDEVSLTQINKALGLDNTGYRTYAKIAIALKGYLNENLKVSIKS